MPAISSFRRIENKHDVYIGKYCMKIFWESLREHAMEIINSEKKKKKNFLIKKSSMNHIKMQKSVIFVKKNSKIKIKKIKKIW